MFGKSIRWMMTLLALAGIAWILGTASAWADVTNNATRPNFVVIQTDDSVLSEMPWMPQTDKLIGDAGETFNRYYVDNSICSPSRASLLTGSYSHNNGVLTNRPSYAYNAFRASSDLTNNLPVWLQAAGYETIHVGKYMNAYGSVSPTEYAPGWTFFNGITGDEDANTYYNATFNNNGVSEVIPEYATTYETSQALNYLNSADGPFYLELDYNAPHFDADGAPGPTPAAQDAGRFPNVDAPRGPSYDLSSPDTPYFIRSLRPLNHHQEHWINQGYRNSLRSLQEVDRGVSQVIQTLEAKGVLDNTYVIFISDNGFFYGQHRIVAGKYLGYEPSTHLPLLIRGPGIKPGSESNSLAENIDLAPTITDLAGVYPSIAPDGRSLAPLFSKPDAFKNRAILLEGYTGDEKTVHWNPHSNNASVTDYYGVVAGPWKYIRTKLAPGQSYQELYNLHTDPEETVNLAPSMPKLVARLNKLTNRLASCRGRSCHVQVKATTLR